MSAESVDNPSAESLPPPLPTAGSRFRRAVATMQFRGFTATFVSRPTGVISLLGVIVGAFVLNPTGNGPSMCGMQRAFHLPCPGCGLTRSVTSFFQGHFDWAFAYHPFGPVFAIAFALGALTLLLPKGARARAVEAMRPWDRVAGWIVMVFCLALLGYGFWRVGKIVGGNPDYAWWRTESTPPFVTQSPERSAEPASGP